MHDSAHVRDGLHQRANAQVRLFVVWPLFSPSPPLGVHRFPHCTDLVFTQACDPIPHPHRYDIALGHVAVIRPAWLPRALIMRYGALAVPVGLAQLFSTTQLSRVEWEIFTHKGLTQINS